MRKETNYKAILAFSLLGAIPVAWLGLLLAPSMEKGLFKMFSDFGETIKYPFRITLVEDSLRAVIIFLLLYGMAIGIYFSTRGNFRRGEEHGSARWGDAASVNRKYSKKPYSDNKILTENVKMGLDPIRHKRNLNTLVVGGWASRFSEEPVWYLPCQLL